jgi:hypothetical protein
MRANFSSLQPAYAGYAGFAGHAFSVHAATEHAASLHAAISTRALYTFGSYNSRHPLNPHHCGFTCATYTACTADVAYSTCSCHRHLCCIITTSPFTTYIACTFRHSRQ